MQISASSSLNTLVQAGVKQATTAAPPKPQATAPVAPAGGSDGDGDNDGSRVGTQLNVKA